MAASPDTAEPESGATGSLYTEVHADSSDELAAYLSDTVECDSCIDASELDPVTMLPRGHLLSSPEDEAEVETGGESAETEMQLAPLDSLRDIGEVVQLTKIYPEWGVEQGTSECDTKFTCTWKEVVLGSRVDPEAEIDRARAQTVEKEEPNSDSPDSARTLATAADREAAAPAKTGIKDAQGEAQDAQLLLAENMTVVVTNGLSDESCFSCTFEVPIVSGVERECEETGIVSCSTSDSEFEFSLTSMPEDLVDALSAVGELHCASRAKAGPSALFEVGEIVRAARCRGLTLRECKRAKHDGRITQITGETVWVESPTPVADLGLNQLQAPRGNIVFGEEQLIVWASAVERDSADVVLETCAIVTQIQYRNAAASSGILANKQRIRCDSLRNKPQDDSKARGFMTVHCKRPANGTGCWVLSERGEFLKGTWNNGYFNDGRVFCADMWNLVAGRGLLKPTHEPGWAAGSYLDGFKTKPGFGGFAGLGKKVWSEASRWFDAGTWFEGDLRQNKFYIGRGMTQQSDKNAQRFATEAEQVAPNTNEAPKTGHYFSGTWYKNEWWQGKGKWIGNRKRVYRGEEFRKKERLGRPAPRRWAEFKGEWRDGKWWTGSGVCHPKGPSSGVPNPLDPHGQSWFRGVWKETAWWSGYGETHQGIDGRTCDDSKLFHVTFGNSDLKKHCGHRWFLGEIKNNKWWNGVGQFWNPEGDHPDVSLQAPKYWGTSADQMGIFAGSFRNGRFYDGEAFALGSGSSKPFTGKLKAGNTISGTSTKLASSRLLGDLVS